MTPKIIYKEIQELEKKASFAYRISLSLRNGADILHEKTFKLRDNGKYTQAKELIATRDFLLEQCFYYQNIGKDYDQTKHLLILLFAKITNKTLQV